MSLEENQQLGTALDANERTAVMRHLTRIEASKYVSPSEQGKKLLRYIVERGIAGAEADLKEYSIGCAVLGKGDDFDPSKDAIVRNAVGKLRTRLAAYYAHEGAAEPWRIEIPVGGYVPLFTFIPPLETATRKPVTDTWRIGKPAWLGKALVGIAAAAILVFIGTVLPGPHKAGTPEQPTTIQFTNLANGGTVPAAVFVAGRGLRPGVNNYLMVQPDDPTESAWVEGQISSPEWTVSAHFGEFDTRAGIRYRVWVLSTKTSLATGKLTVQPETPVESPAIIVTRK